MVENDIVGGGGVVVIREDRGEEEVDAGEGAKVVGGEGFERR